MTTRVEVVTKTTGRLLKNDAAFAQFRKTGIRQALQRSGRLAKVLLGIYSRSAGAIWKERYVNGWVFRTTANTLVVNNKEKHAIFIERGRRPHAKPPPVAAIEEWVRDKLGPNVNPYLVARSIGRKGILAKPVLEHPQTRAEITHVVVLSLNKELRKLLKGSE